MRDITPSLSANRPPFLAPSLLSGRVDARLSRRRLLQAGAAGAAGAAILPAAGCSSDDGGGGGEDGQLNVLVLIIDSLRPGSRWRVRLPADPDAEHRRAREPRPALLARLSRGDGHRAGAPLDLRQPADLPVPQLEAEQGDRHEPGLAADRRPAEDLHHRALKDHGYWTAQVSDNPFIAFMKAFEPFRETFHEWRTIVGQSGFRKPPENVSHRRGGALAAALPARRPLHPRHAQVPRQHGRGPGRGGDLRGARLQGRAPTSSTTPAAASRSR